MGFNMNDRPIYETEESREIEKQMAEFLCRVWRCELKKLPIAYNLDYAAVRDHSVVAWLELKRRFRTLHAHHGVFLSLQKVMSAVRLHDYSDRPCFFVVLCDDGYHYADILKQKYPIEFRGRVDRNDWQDQEPVIDIPVWDFLPIIEPQASA